MELHKSYNQSILEFNEPIKYRYLKDIGNCKYI